MGTKRKDRITVGVTALILFGFLTGNIAKSDDTVSVSERRKLAQFPKINVENMKDGTFMSGFESYAKDQFPLREQFRALKTAFSMYVLGQKDQHGLYIKDGYIAKMEYPLHADSLQYAVTRFGEVYDRYLSDTDTDIYLAIVPDKSYFLADENGYPSMDYDMLTAQMRDGTKYAQYIDIFGDLELSDYYRTDAHWRQNTKQKNWKIHFTVSIMDSSHFMDSLIHCIIWIMTCLKTVSCMIMKTERKIRFTTWKKQRGMICMRFFWEDRNP